jgi:putative ABC transport system substrate-binding protein
VSQGAATPAVMRANPTVPVVFGFSGDPVVARFVQSLARPGANATGVSFMSVELNPKRIDFVRAALPHARKFGLLSNANHAGEENEIVACQQALQPVGVQLSVYRVSGMNEIQPAVARALEDGIEVLVVLPSSSMVRQAASIANQCLARKVPVVSGWASMARDGLLLTYGPNLTDAYRRVAWYAMRVLGGAKPGDLPVEQPTKFELVVNKRTAATLGLTLPLGLLAQAEEIIE